MPLSWELAQVVAGAWVKALHISARYKIKAGMASDCRRTGFEPTKSQRELRKWNRWCWMEEPVPQAGKKMLQLSSKLWRKPLLTDSSSQGSGDTLASEAPFLHHPQGTGSSPLTYPFLVTPWVANTWGLYCSRVARCLLPFGACSLLLSLSFQGYQISH